MAAFTTISASRRLETYQTVLVSDGGGKMQPEEEPKSDWARHSYRVLN